MKAWRWLLLKWLLLQFALDCRKKAKICEDMKKKPEKFEGLYQPVLLLSQDGTKRKSALKEWKIRANNLFPDSALASFTNRYCEGSFAEAYPRKTAQFLVDCFRKAGIAPDELDDSKQLTVSELQAMAYRALDGHEIEEAECITVITPAWYYHGRIVEHGMCGELI